MIFIRKEISHNLTPCLFFYGEKKTSKKKLISGVAEQKRGYEQFLNFPVSFKSFIYFLLNVRK